MISVTSINKTDVSTPLKGSMSSGLLGLLLMGALVVMSVGLTGCVVGDVPPLSKTVGEYKDGTELKENQAVLYFLREENNKVTVEGVIREIPERRMKNKILFTMQELFRGPRPEEEKMGFYTEIPKDARMLSMGRSSLSFRITLNEAFTKGGGSTSMTKRVEQLERTIRSIDEDKPIYVYVNGKELEIIGGEGLEIEQPLNKPRG